MQPSIRECNNPYYARYVRGLRCGLLLGTMLGIALAWIVVLIGQAVGGWLV